VGSGKFLLQTRVVKMTQVIKPQTTNLYDRDLALWIECTIDQLKARNFEELDIENLSE
jgi:hypothetical protein